MRIEITLQWLTDVVEVRRVDDVARFTIGVRAEDDLFVPLAANERASHALLTRAPDGTTWLWPQGEAPVVIAAGAEHVLTFGAFTVRVRAVERERRLVLPRTSDTRFANISTVTGATMAALVALFVLTPEPVRASVDPLPVGLLPAWVTTRATPPRHDPTPSSVVEAASSRPPARRAAAASAKRARAAHDSAAAALAAVSMLVPGDVAAIAGASGDALGAALASIGRAEVAGLALGPTTGGGVANDTLAIGSLRGRVGEAVSSREHAAGADLCGGLGCKNEHDVVMVSQGPVLSCGGDVAAPCENGRDIIRRVVREHHGQVRHCFELALQRTPGLGGRTSLSWRVTPDGAVAAATAVESDMPAAFGECLVAKVKTWRFPPAPAWRDGIVVRYPFVFRPGG